MVLHVPAGAATKAATVAAGSSTVSVGAVLAGADLAAILTAGIAAIAAVGASVLNNRAKQDETSADRLGADFDRLTRENQRLIDVVRHLEDRVNALEDAVEAQRFQKVDAIIWGKRLANELAMHGVTDPVTPTPKWIDDD